MKRFFCVIFTILQVHAFSQTETDDAWIEKMLDKADSCYAIRSLAYAREYYNMAFGPMTRNEELHQKRKSRQNKFYYCVYIITADTALSHKEYEKATRLYNLALDLTPEDEYAQAQLDKCSANISVKPICPASPNQEKARALFRLGDSLYVAGAFEKAKNEYGKILQIDPGLSQAKENILRCDYKLWEASLPYQKIYDSKKRLKFEGTINGENFYTGMEYMYSEAKNEKPKLIQWEKGKVIGK
jgi:tetratricopeptide (TPR) repeat protein